MNRPILLVAVALGLFAITNDAAAQDEWIAQVHAQLDEAGVMMASDGYLSTHEITTGSLGVGATETLELELDGGVHYLILGVCDVDCSDVDLILRDESGTVVDSDLLADDVPIVEVAPQRTGIYTVDVHMASCSAAPCRYGVGVYGR